MPMVEARVSEFKFYSELSPFSGSRIDSKMPFHLLSIGPRNRGTRRTTLGVQDLNFPSTFQHQSETTS